MSIRWSLTAACPLSFLLVCCGGGGHSTVQDADADAEEDSVQDADDVIPDTSDDDLADTETDFVACTSRADCYDGDLCTMDDCDTETGECSHAPTDMDRDGYPASTVEGEDCGGTDCDDTDNTVHPDAARDCTGAVDRNCDGMDDDDEDGDGHDSETCGGDDCDDADPRAFPGSLEQSCDRDLDCNGVLDADNDGDGHDSEACGGGDCDDADDEVHPGAGEANCDGLDTDCNGEMSLMEDPDQDGYASAVCVATGAEADCDDTDATIHPHAPTTCDTVDDDCTGSWLDDDDVDDDSDGYMDMACGGDDCDDEDATNHPGADNDDDGFVDVRCGGDDCDDFDATTNPSIVAACTFSDHNCNGNPDEDDDGDGELASACGGDDCRDDDPSTLLGDCSGVNLCCDGCWPRNGCWIDQTTGYVWEDPPMGGSLSWTSASSYCSALSLAGFGPGEWHLPGISELRTFIRGCTNTMPGGPCAATDACPASGCLSAECYSGCTAPGPGEGGCFWDPEVQGHCYAYWSATTNTTQPQFAWAVSFWDGYVSFGIDKTDPLDLRCVHH